MFATRYSCKVCTADPQPRDTLNHPIVAGGPHCQTSFFHLAGITSFWNFGRKFQIENLLTTATSTIQLLESLTDAEKTGCLLSCLLNSVFNTQCLMMVMMVPLVRLNGAPKWWMPLSKQRGHRQTRPLTVSFPLALLAYNRRLIGDECTLETKRLLVSYQW